MLSNAATVKFRGEWSLSNLPPEGHDDVGPFFFHLFQLAYDEREKKNLTKRWMENHRIFRGKHWKTTGGKNDAKKVTINLFFANVQRTVANITAKEPQAEVVEISETDNAQVETVASFSTRAITVGLSRRMKKWYNKTEQGKKLTSSVLNMEIYGTTIEKAVWNSAKGDTDVIVVDPYAFLPAPGYFPDIPESMPYCCHMTPLRVDEIETIYGVEGINVSDVYSVLGEEREDNRPIPAGSVSTTSMRSSGRDKRARDNNAIDPRALVIETWVRDYSRGKDGELIYPGGIRVVTLTNEGQVVLTDMANPNVNQKMKNGVNTGCYLYNRFPFWKADSYEDAKSFWGFSSAEQVADLNLKIDELLSRIANHLGRVMLPTLIVPRDTGITLDEINNKPGLVLQPSNMGTAQGIRYIAPPNLPSNFIELLNTYISLFDRVSQIEDADRGQSSGGVIAASAIVALQERGAVLMRHKIRSVDYLARQRGRVAISNYQNFGMKREEYESDDDQKVLVRGVDLSARKLDYIVESGSTVHRTEAQIQEQAAALYETGVIDRQALLETVKFPNWRDVIERVGEGQLAQALQILQQAGLSQEEAAALEQYLMEPQSGRANTGKAGAPAQPGVPTAQQGLTQ